MYPSGAIAQSGGSMNVSYAQNFEDYVLWLALGEKRNGYYIDVGGGHPVADNVSCWFYLQGWSGIVVEPQQSLARAYAFTRPRDFVFCGVAGTRSGEAYFHIIDRLHGFSSLRANAASVASQFGATHRVERVEMATLDELIARNGSREIDFLKIDVEGAEADVLAGLDLALRRPRAMCIEAVAPGDMAENWGDWEPRLLASGYEFMLFDGLNRYYAAREADDVRARFPRERPEWGIVPTFGAWERAPTNQEHPDHALALKLARGFLAALPQLEPGLLLDLLTCGMSPADLSAPATHEARRAALELLLPGPWAAPVRAQLAGIEAGSVRAFCEAVTRSDQYRIALARIAMSYDGGQIVEGRFI
jgi:FkbM family methyltransferase